ncbi:unnamed protein product, partial [Allacma fusca]
AVIQASIIVRNKEHRVLFHQPSGAEINLPLNFRMGQRSNLSEY